MLIYWRVTTLFHLFPKLLAVLQAVGIITLIKCADAEDVPPATSGMIRDHMCVPFFGSSAVSLFSDVFDFFTVASGIYIYM